MPRLRPSSLRSMARRRCMTQSGTGREPAATGSWNCAKPIALADSMTRRAGVAPRPRWLRVLDAVLRLLHLIIASPKRSGSNWRRAQGVSSATIATQTLPIYGRISRAMPRRSLISSG